MLVICLPTVGMEKKSSQNNVPCFLSTSVALINPYIATLSLNSVFYFPIPLIITGLQHLMMVVLLLFRSLDAYLIMLVDRGDFRNFVEWFPEQL